MVSPPCIIGLLNILTPRLRYCIILRSKSWTKSSRRKMSADILFLLQRALTVITRNRQRAVHTREAPTNAGFDLVANTPEKRLCRSHLDNGDRNHLRKPCHCRQFHTINSASPHPTLNQSFRLDTDIADSSVPDAIPTDPSYRRRCTTQRHVSDSRWRVWLDCRRSLCLPALLDQWVHYGLGRITDSDSEGFRWEG
jgi:hypothetical protein